MGAKDMRRGREFCGDRVSDGDGECSCVGEREKVGGVEQWGAPSLHFSNESLPQHAALSRPWKPYYITPSQPNIKHNHCSVGVGLYVWMYAWLYICELTQHCTRDRYDVRMGTDP
jgi:hypothetical protein